MQRHLLVLIGLILAAIASVGIVEHQRDAYAQGAGPIGRPPLGGNLPQDLDTISPALTAGTVQTQAGATLCTYTICNVTVSASAANGIALRQCTQAPMRQLVANTSTNTITVYGSGTDTINGIATATGIVQPKMTSTIQSGVVEYVCVVGGTAAQWVTH